MYENSGSILPFTITNFVVTSNRCSLQSTQGMRLGTEKRSISQIILATLFSRLKASCHLPRYNTYMMEVSIAHLTLEVTLNNELTMLYMPCHKSIVKGKNEMDIVDGST